MNLDSNVPRTPFKDTTDIVYISFRARTPKCVPYGLERLAAIVNDIHQRYGILGFLAEPTAMELATQEQITAQGSDLILPPNSPTHALYAFIRMANPEHVKVVQEEMDKEGLSSGDGALGVYILEE